MKIVKAHASAILPVSRRTFLHQAGAAGAAASFAALCSNAVSAQQSATWYSASGSKNDQDWVNMFKAKTGNTIEFFRIGGVKLTQRIEQEIKAKQLKPSVMDFSIPGLMNEWVKKGWVMKYESPEAKHYPADLRSEGYWTPINVLTVAIAYNADHVKPEEAPRTWEDLLNPKWKGKMVASDAQSSGAVLHSFSALQKAFGKSYVEKLAKQQVLIKIGSGATLQTMVSGERPVAALILDYYVAGAIRKGANLAIVQPDAGIPASLEIIAIPAAAPNPELGKNFLDFALSKPAQDNWQQKHGTLSLRDDVAPVKPVRGRKAMKNIKLLKSGIADLEDSYHNQRKLVEQWVTLFK
jgi:iron(III) transport system substrate-binding protein